MMLVLLFLISPILGMGWFEFGLSLGEFLLLAGATVFIATGGNILNDIYDINADGINKPGKNIVGRKITVANSWTLYWLFTVLGILSGSVLSWLLGQINYALIFLFSAGLLWFYSQKYQCQPLVGNIVVSVLSAVSIGIVWLFQFFALSRNAEVFTGLQTEFDTVNRMILIYMGFAFGMSLIREVLKDIQDFKGDDRFGCRTFAVVYGIQNARKLAIALLWFAALAVVALQYYFIQFGFQLHGLYFIILDVLFVITIIKLHKSQDEKDFANLSVLIKLIMIFGVSSIIIFYF
jgi:4-hydroxybenzoate polyprenyltransferase